MKNLEETRKSIEGSRKYLESKSDSIVKSFKDLENKKK
jgi:hypothetical protein